MNVLPPRFAEGIIRSERRRILLFLGLLGIFGAFVCAFFISPEWVGHAVAVALHAPLLAAAPAILTLIGLLMAFELIAYRRLCHLEKTGGSPGTSFRLLQAALEVSWVTGLLLLSAHAIGAMQTFAGPVILFYFPAIALSALNLDFRLSLWSGFVAAAGFGLIVMLYLPSAAPVEGLPLLTSRHQYGIRVLVLLASGAASAFVASWLRRQLFATLANARERDLAIAIFGQHVSPQVADRLLHQPARSLGEERDVCVMFLDIRNFSVMASQRSAGDVMEYLNRLFGGLITCVNAHKGIVNKFLGDGFMAVFGAPEGDENLCANAVRCACGLLEEVERMNRSGEIPPTRVGIGLHLGPAVTGIVGSDIRKEYTVIGDSVNLAARIEQATKPLNCSLLVSEAVWNALPENSFQAEDMGPVELKGQAKPARLFKLA